MQHTRKGHAFLHTYLYIPLESATLSIITLWRHENFSELMVSLWEAARTKQRWNPNLIRSDWFIIIVPVPAPKCMGWIDNLELPMTKACFTKNRPIRLRVYVPVKNIFVSMNSLENGQDKKIIIIWCDEESHTTELNPLCSLHLQLWCGRPHKDWTFPYIHVSV